MTFSLVACDLEAGEWGVSVASKFLAVGAVVPWARGDVGAIATQSYANVIYGPNGLALLAEGADAQSVLDRLVADDAGRDQRQAGIVDATGGIVWSRSTVDTSVTLPADLRLLRGTEYFWSVDALLADGHSMTTRAHHFSIR